jgi:hypothetical protein
VISRLITGSVTAVIVAAGCTACTGWQPRQAPPPAPAASAPARPAPSSDAVALLPVSPASLGTASRTAARFAAAYVTWSWRQPPAAWAARLRPLATAELARQLAQAAATPGSVQARQSSTGTVTAERVRLLAAAMIILIVQVRQVTTGPAGKTTAITSLAITVVPSGGGGWAVYDAEPASAGDTGGVPGAAP